VRLRPAAGLYSVALEREGFRGAEGAVTLIFAGDHAALAGTLTETKTHVWTAWPLSLSGCAERIHGIPLRITRPGGNLLDSDCRQQVVHRDQLGRCCAHQHGRIGRHMLRGELVWSIERGLSPTSEPAAAGGEETQ